MVQITIKLKTHGVLHGEKMDISEWPEPEMEMVCAESKWLPLFQIETETNKYFL